MRPRVYVKQKKTLRVEVQIYKIKQGRPVNHENTEK